MGAAMTFDLDQAETLELVEAMYALLEEHLGFLPDMVLIVSKGIEARTFYASSDLTSTVHPHERLRRTLAEALATHNKRHPVVNQ